MNLREKIVDEIRSHGAMPFSRYMEMCLYDPELGYYSRKTEQFGKTGDFYTSSDVHAVFGRLLARQFEEMWRAMDRPASCEIVELGPGRGLFARDVLDWSEKKFPEFFGVVHYTLLERSASLRAKLESNLNRHIAAGKVSFERVSGSNVPTVVFANEFFDALPVDVLSSEGQLRVSEKDGRLVETWAPATVAQLEYLDRYGVHPEPGERVEVAWSAVEIMASLASSLAKGFLVVVDYGYTREEQLAGRHRDTIMTYRQHSASPSPYEAPGAQDITAHVNFTALSAVAQANGMKAEPLLTQSQFLLGVGEPTQFADAFEDCRVPQERAKVALQLKHLVTPAGMGETFHVLIASNGVSPEKVGSLTGLGFGKSRL